MTTDKQREEFETFARGKKLPLDLDYLGCYEHPIVNGAWSGWQAAQAAMLPEIEKEKIS